MRKEIEELLTSIERTLDILELPFDDADNAKFVRENCIAECRISIQKILNLLYD